MNDHSVAMFHAALKVVIKRAIIVLDALGDSEMRCQNQGQVWIGRSTMRAGRWVYSLTAHLE